MLLKTHFDSPLGPMTAVSLDGALAGLWFDGQRHFAAGYDLASISTGDEHAVFFMTKAWLDAYFSKPGCTPDLPLPPFAPCGTDYQKRVWTQLLNVPYGALSSYGQIASGLSSGARAAAGAISRNPILILVPCHRIIRKNGDLGGFDAGLERKQALLRIENAK